MIINQFSTAHVWVSLTWVDSLEKTLMLGGIGGRRRRGRQRMRWLNGITDLMDWVWVNSGSWWWTGRPGVLWFMGSQRVRHDWATELNWSTRLCLLGSYLLMEIQKITLCRVAHWLETSEVSKCLHSKNIRTCWYMNILIDHLLHFLCLECKLTYVLIRL